MFTGIITHIGIVEKLTAGSGDLSITIKIEDQSIPATLALGSSVACSGICLTLIKKIKVEKNYYLDFQASHETITKTTIGQWQTGDKINIEFALKLGDELGGHLVSGHIDAVAQIKSITKIGDSHRFIFNFPPEFKKFICPKGSVVINGISLTVNETGEENFSANIIPHSFENTNLRELKAGDRVNLEIDLIARYLHNFMANQLSFGNG